MLTKTAGSRNNALFEEQRKQPDRQHVIAATPTLLLSEYRFLGRWVPLGTRQLPKASRALRD